MATSKGKAASKPVKTVVHNDAPSKPQSHRADAAKPGPTDFVAVPHHDKNSGYKGKFVPATPAARKAAKAFLAKMNASESY